MKKLAHNLRDYGNTYCGFLIFDFRLLTEYQVKSKIKNRKSKIDNLQ